MAEQVGVCLSTARAGCHQSFGKAARERDRAPLGHNFRLWRIAAIGLVASNRRLLTKAEADTRPAFSSPGAFSRFCPCSSAQNRNSTKGMARRTLKVT
jgi:hypothetical protein